MVEFKEKGNFGKILASKCTLSFSSNQIKEFKEKNYLGNRMGTTEHPMTLRLTRHFEIRF